MNFISQIESLVISDLPLECKEPDLLMLAQTYGRVKSCEIKRDFRNHVISVYGIISYYTLDSAENAFRALNGARYMGKTLKATWLPRTQTGNSGSASVPQAPKNLRTAQVHISYLSKQLNFIISEQFLRDVFSNFGSVLEIALKKTCVDPEMSVQNGYGFVHYPLTPEGIQSALTAVNSLHQVTINQITFDCSISNQLNQILSNMDKNKGGHGNNRRNHNNNNNNVALHEQMMQQPAGRMAPRNFPSSMPPAVNPGPMNAGYGMPMNNVGRGFPRTMGGGYENEKQQQYFAPNPNVPEFKPMQTYGGNNTGFPNATAGFRRNFAFENSSESTYYSQSNMDVFSSMTSRDDMFEKGSNAGSDTELSPTNHRNQQQQIRTTSSFHSETSTMTSVSTDADLSVSFPPGAPGNQRLIQTLALEELNHNFNEAGAGYVSPTSTSRNNSTEHQQQPAMPLMNGNGYSMWSY